MATKRPVRRVSNEDQPLKELFEDFQARNRYKNLTQSTLDNYAHTFGQFLEFVGEDTTGKEIFEKTIINFVNVLKERDIKPASINHYLRGLRAFLYWAMDSGYIGHFKVLLMREQEPVKETYTPEELQVLLREPKSKASYVEWRSWAVINWILDNGNRAQTVCSVRMADFSLEGQCVTLAHTKNRKAQTGRRP